GTPAAGKPVKRAVLEYASRMVGERLADDVWSRDAPPAHLLMNVRVSDEARRELAMGRDLAELRQRLGEAASLTMAQARPQMERDDIAAWDFGELPAQVSFRRGNQTLTGYPALAPAAGGEAAKSPSAAAEGRAEGLAIRLYDTPGKSAEAHREGVKRLMARELKEQLRNLERGMPGFNALAMKFQATIPADRLKADLLEAIVDRAFLGDDPVPRTPREFEEQKKRAKARLPAVAEAALRHLGAIVEASRQYGQAAAQGAALGRVMQEVRSARDRLVYPGFLARTPWERLEHLPRYLRGYALRLQKYRAGGQERDQKHAHTVQTLWQNYETRAEADRAAGRSDPKLEEFRWLVEELRVSLFAQELRTPLPVSAKRLQKFWSENLG
ncbi:MAG TPA: DUF3418 domain-containing protein, partial [Myxococcota bacterium]|nr:DUF3418 domain-containing protein [Myxococcota bacterium]